MGAQLAKPNAKAKSLRSRVQKLRKNRTDPLFTTTSPLSLDRSESLIHIHDYQLTSPSYLDLYQQGRLEIDERPEDWIRAYKDIKNRVLSCDDSVQEWYALKRELCAFVQDLNECDVWELRSTLLEKAHRLGPLLDERHPAGGHAAGAKQALDAVDESVQGEGAHGDGDDASPSANVRKAHLFRQFLHVSCRLDEVRYGMIEYYGDDKQPEFHAILGDLAAIMRELKEIKDGGELSVIVTREEYEDYITALQQRFLRLVDINMKQAKTSIFSGGMARTVRTRRSNSNVSIE